MVASTSKISDLVQRAEPSRVNPEVRTAALVLIISLLGLGLSAFVVCVLGFTPASE